MTFLAETQHAIKESGHTPEDIIFIGSEHSGHQCTWEEFQDLAEFEYDSGYGASEIATDLIVVFKDNIMMTRGEYDGSEWWEYNSPFVMPKENIKITSLGGEDCLWNSLATICEK